MFTGNTRPREIAKSMEARWGPSFDYEHKCEGCGKVFWVDRAKHRKEIIRGCKIWCSMQCMKKWSKVGAASEKWTGGKDSVGQNGYVWCYVGRKYPGNHAGRLMKHRFVMEQHLGRSLRRSESVHHLDGNKQNNELVNLELWESGHPSGSRTYATNILDYQI